MEFIMKVYELYLDESGRFVEGIEEQSKNLKPSLIGGYLVEEGKMSKEKAKIILGKSYVHMCEENNSKKDYDKTDPIDIIKKLKDIGGKIVIFQNFERINVLKDRDLLYLNMLTEGIVNLIDKLSILSQEEIKLKVIAANRLNYNEGYENKVKIDIEEYNKRILEKVYMRLLEGDKLAYNKFNIELDLASARYDTRLMISDVICNTRITVESNKFSKEEQRVIKSLYKESSYIFSVFKTSLQKEIENSIKQNNISNAMLKLCEIKDKDKYNELSALLISHINNMESQNLEIQIDLLSLRIRTIINIQGNLEFVEKFLKIMQEEILPKVDRKSFAICKLKLDVSSYLLTVYTHQGNNLKSKEQIDISNKILKEIDGSWDFLNYYFIINIREAVMYINALLYEKAANLLENVIKNADSIVEVIKCIDDFSNMKLDILGKSLGTRLQAYSRLIPIDKKYYELAVDDSNNAMSQFITDNDLARQCIYRVDIECRMGNCKEALKYLAKSVKKNEVNYNEILKEIANIKSFSRHYSVLSYFQIMSTAAENNDEKLANDMYLAFGKNQSLYNEYLKNDGQAISEYNGEKIIIEERFSEHPFELIYWYLGKYFKIKDIKTAKFYFDKSVKICDMKKDSTLSATAIAVECDKILLQNKCNANTICQRFEALYSRGDYLINQFLDSIKEDISILKVSKDEEQKVDICKKLLKRIAI